MTAVPSHLVEDTNVQFAWDSTTLGALKTCPRYYYYRYIENWTGKHESYHLRFGTEVHTAIQGYHLARARGRTHDQALHIAVRDLVRRVWTWEVDLDDKVGKLKNRDSVVRTVVDYLDHYHPDPAQTFIKDDGKPAVELSFTIFMGFTVKGQDVALCGHLDRVVKYAGDLYVNDYKTTTTTPGTYYFKNYSPDNQMSIYALAARSIFQSPIRGVIIDAIQILTNSTNCVRGVTYRTKAQLEEWLKDFKFYVRLAVEYAEANYWPMNDRACRFCQFREICNKDPDRSREIWLEKDFVRGEPWNPLKPR